MGVPCCEVFKWFLLVKCVTKFKAINYRGRVGVWQACALINNVILKGGLSLRGGPYFINHKS